MGLPTNQLDDLPPIPTETVEVDTHAGPRSITVRGLDLGDIILLLRTNGDVLRELYEKAAAAQKGEIKAEDLDFETIAVDLMDRADSLVALVIACGCGQPDKWERIASMPPLAQMALLEAVVRLTLLAQGGPKKALENVVTVMSRLSGLVSRSE